MVRFLGAIVQASDHRISLLDLLTLRNRLSNQSKDLGCLATFRRMHDDTVDLAIVSYGFDALASLGAPSGPVSTVVAIEKKIDVAS
jgi:hypothetical protein